MPSVPKPTHRKRKTEKVTKIIMQEARECWVCGCTVGLEEHHVFGGANRKKSEKYGLTVFLCHNHHNENIPGDSGVHFNPGLMLRLKQEAQKRFEEVYGHMRFMREFGRNYL